MDPLITVLAFGCGYLASRANLPPLVGYLVAGFFLSILGYESGSFIKAAGEFGVTILLFSIGLKLKIKGLLRPEVWGGASLHMLITIAIFSAGLMGLSSAGLAFFADMELSTSLLLAFALSFSSTVFAVKILEESGRSSSLNGRTAIGVLIMQDIFAVLYLTFSTGKLPTWWAIAILAALPLARWVFMRMLDRIGHSELQVLFGFFLAFVAGAYGFEIVGLKAALGALIMGILLAPHARAKDLAKSLLNIKDFLLVAFFLDIGLTGLPSLEVFGVSLILIAALPIKACLFLLLFTRFRFKARTSFITSLNLGSYSEFGLIVGGLAFANGWLSSDWLLAIAVALSISLVLASPFNRKADVLYDSVRGALKRLETKKRHQEELPYKQDGWKIAIIGMGRVGTGTYDYFTEKLGRVVVGLDFSADTVEKHRAANRRVILADVTDPDFWHRLPSKRPSAKLLILTMPILKSQLYAAQKVREYGFDGEIVAVVQYDDEVEILREAGVDMSWNLYGEAGIGLASHICNTLDISALISPQVQTDILKKDD